MVYFGERSLFFHETIHYLYETLLLQRIQQNKKEEAVALKISAQPLFCAKKLQPGFRKVWLLV